MIRSFRHKGLREFFLSGTKAGIQPAHATRLADQLLALNNASSPGAMNVPGWRLHPLDGELNGHWSVRVSANWRIVFAFEGTDAVLVDYQDYH